MRKGEFKKTSECLNGDFIIYRTSQWRWEDSANPIYKNIEYHLTLDRAEKCVNEMEVEVGFSTIIERMTIDYAVLNENWEFREELELSELDSKYFEVNVEIVQEGYTECGKSLEGSIIVSCSWDKYVGYCRNFNGIRYGRYDEYEKDLINENSERVFRLWEFVLLSSEDVSGLSDEEILELVYEELDNDSYKWNYFRNRFTEEKIINGLNLTINDLEISE